MIASAHPFRTRFAKDILAEVMLPIQQKGSVIILCSGLPSSPSKTGTLGFLAEKGYVVIHPRYRGTWESGGIFLQNSPVKDILDTVRQIATQKKVYNLSEKKWIPIRVKNIFIVGVSFGGPAALLASRMKEVKKVVAISPVIDFKVESKGEPFKEFVEFTTEEFGMAYRPAHTKDWKKLLETDFYNPIDHVKKLDGKKIFIVHAEDDDIVPIEPSKEFIEKVGGAYYWKKVGGHPLHIHHQFIWKKIESFLKTK